MKKLLVLIAVGVVFVPVVALLGVGVVANPAVINAACGETGTLSVTGEVPDRLTATTAAGKSITLSRMQLTHARTIIVEGSRVPGVGRAGVQIALMAALTESTLRMLANTGSYPESGSFPNDGNGSDHDSLGLFQMRPQAGWGTVAELMDPAYQAKAFFGGASGPNRGSPPGLLDIGGWQAMTKAQAAQAVEVSRYPDRYADYEPVAATILGALTTTPSPGPPPGAGSVPETTRVVFPMADGTWTLSARFGPRTDPFTGKSRMHQGIDLAAAAGTPILAAADGVVVYAGMGDGYHGRITIRHTVRGLQVTSVYLHMWKNGIHVREGDHVTAGQHIADVGSSGRSTGPHLHFEIRPGGPDAAPVDPQAWLAANGATEPGPTDPGGCQPGS